MMEAADKTKVVDREARLATEDDPDRSGPEDTGPSRRPTIPPDGEPVPQRSLADLGSGGSLDLLGVRRLVGRYEVIHRLGHGGMATVYLGRAIGTAGFERLVAVKVIHPHLAREPEFVEMFLDEARIAARIHHPNVVEVIDLGEEEDLLFMVMEYVEGDTLSSLLRQLKKAEASMPVSAALQIVADACKGLAAAHDLIGRDGRPLELVHRDVSPHNLLITMDGRVKVVDFGIMKAAGKRSTTLTGQLRGKVPYMSPEQAKSRPVDRRTDLFALGAVLWEMLAGERLFSAPTESATLALVLECNVPDLFERRDDLPEDLRPILERALAPEPHERYDSAQDMLRDVRAVLRQIDDEPRDVLAEAMKEHFGARIDYIQAAIRGSGEDERGVRALRGEAGLTELGRTTPLGAAGSSQAMPSRLTPSVGAALPSGTLTTSSLATAPARSWLLWLLLPLAGAAIGTAVMRWQPDSDADSKDSTVQTPAAVVEPEPERAVETDRPAEAKMVKWWFDTTPPGAALIVQGQRHAALTPTVVELPSSDEPVLVRIEKEGFRPREVRLTPLASENHFYKLDPLPTETDSTPRGAGAKFTARVKSGSGKSKSRSKADGKGDGEQKDASTSPSEPKRHGDDRTFEDMPDFDALKKGKSPEKKEQP